MPSCPFRLPAFIGLLLSLTLLAAPGRVRAQSPARSRVDTAMTVPMIAAGGGFALPGGDYADRFGPGPLVGVGFWLKLRRGWLLGLDYTFYFTGKVREGVLDSIKLPDSSTPNAMIGSDGLLTDVRITGRGYLPMVSAGRVWPAHLPGTSVNAGLMTTLGVGFWQHKINFEDVGTSAVQLHGEYIKGYDRLTNGLALTQRVGYLYLSEQRRINFYAALEVTEGFTRSRRAWDFSTHQHDTRQRFDVVFGARLGWLFAVYKKLPREYYYD